MNNETNQLQLNNECQASDCDQQAVICWECVRALAFMWWGAIARHGEGVSSKARCLLCEVGRAESCARCAILGENGVVEYRKQLRAWGNELGEPDWIMR